MKKVTIALSLVFAAAACEPRDDARTDTVPAAEQPTTADDVAAHDPATIPFIREGRTLHFGGREWLLVGEPVFNPILRYVGSAEGVDLFATPEGRAPSETLFFHLGNDRWQPLQPAPGRVDVADDTMAFRPDTGRVPPR